MPERSTQKTKVGLSTDIVAEISALGITAVRTETKLDHFLEDQKRQDTDIARVLQLHDQRDAEFQQQRSFGRAH